MRMTGRSDRRSLVSTPLAPPASPCRSVAVRASMHVWRGVHRRSRDQPPGSITWRRQRGRTDGSPANSDRARRKAAVPRRWRLLRSPRPSWVPPAGRGSPSWSWSSTSGSCAASRAGGARATPSCARPRPSSGSMQTRRSTCSPAKISSTATETARSPSPIPSPVGRRRMSSASRADTRCTRCARSTHSGSQPCSRSRSRSTHPSDSDAPRLILYLATPSARR
jgi:hypothetical protein